MDNLSKGTPEKSPPSTRKVARKRSPTVLRTLSSKQIPKDDAVSVLSLDSRTDSLPTPLKRQKGKKQIRFVSNGLTSRNAGATNVSDHDGVLLLTTQPITNLSGLRKLDAPTKNLKGKRRCKVDDFANALSKNKLKPGTGITTSNNFDVLWQVDVALKCRCAVVSDSTRVHKVKVSEVVRSSTEASQFFRDHTFGK